MNEGQPNSKGAVSELMISYIKFANTTRFVDISLAESKTFKAASNVLLHVADRCFNDRLDS